MSICHFWLFLSFKRDISLQPLGDPWEQHPGEAQQRTRKSISTNIRISIKVIVYQVFPGDLLAYYGFVFWVWITIFKILAIVIIVLPISALLFPKNPTWKLSNFLKFLFFYFFLDIFNKEKTDSFVACKLFLQFLNPPGSGPRHVLCHVL